MEKPAMSTPPAKRDLYKRDLYQEQINQVIKEELANILSELQVNEAKGDEPMTVEELGILMGTPGSGYVPGSLRSQMALNKIQRRLNAEFHAARAAKSPKYVDVNDPSASIDDKLEYLKSGNVMGSNDADIARLEREKARRMSPPPNAPEGEGEWVTDDAGNWVPAPPSWGNERTPLQFMADAAEPTPEEAAEEIAPAPPAPRKKRRGGGRARWGRNAAKYIDSDYDAFYDDLEHHGLMDILGGEKGKDRKFGRLHKKAWRALQKMRAGEPAAVASQSALDLVAQLKDQDERVAAAKAAEAAHKPWQPQQDVKTFADIKPGMLGANVEPIVDDHGNIVSFKQTTPSNMYMDRKRAREGTAAALSAREPGSAMAWKATRDDPDMRVAVQDDTGDPWTTDKTYPGLFGDPEEIALHGRGGYEDESEVLSAQPLREAKNHKSTNEDRVLKEAFDRMKVLANIKKS
jgi:hypothetical protein